MRKTTLHRYLPLYTSENRCPTALPSESPRNPALDIVPLPQHLCRAAPARYPLPRPPSCPSRSLPPARDVASLLDKLRGGESAARKVQSVAGRSNRPRGPFSAAAELGPAGRRRPRSGQAPARPWPGRSGRCEAEVPRPVRGGAALRTAWRLQRDRTPERRERERERDGSGIEVLWS